MQPKVNDDGDVSFFSTIISVCFNFQIQNMSSKFPFQIAVKSGQRVSICGARLQTHFFGIVSSRYNQSKVGYHATITFFW